MVSAPRWRERAAPATWSHLSASACSTMAALARPTPNTSLELSLQSSRERGRDPGTAARLRMRADAVNVVPLHQSIGGTRESGRPALHRLQVPAEPGRAQEGLAAGEPGLGISLEVVDRVFVRVLDGAP